MIEREASLSDHENQHLHRNLKLYPAYVALYNAFFWMPVFFLYFGQHLPLSEVLLLESLYYLAVVFLEVPSGYFSDRVGRKTTMLVSAVSLSVAYIGFVLGDSFAVFAVAQLFLAGGIAFNSGTDTSFHYDSLAAVGLTDEYDDREARVARTSLAATGVAALVGGFAGAYDLGAAYALSAVFAILSIGVVLAFREPPHTEEASPFVSQVGECLGQLRRSSLRWLFGFAVLSVVVNHVPYEFYQPYLGLVGGSIGFGESTSVVTGIHMASATLLGAWFARRSARFAKWAGTANALLVAAGIQIAVITTMGAVLHPVVVLVILLRGVPGALTRAPLNAAVVPRIPQQQRATYLSIQSLVGRLSFSIVLAGLSLYAGESSVKEWSAISPLLLIAAAVVAAAWLLLFAFRRDVAVDAEVLPVD